MRKRITYQIVSLVIICVCLLQTQVVHAQWTLDVMGSIKKEETKKRMEGATITVKRNGSVFKTLSSPSDGKFQISLPPDATYVIEFSKPGHVSKRIELSTKHVPPDDAKYGFDFPMEMNLFEEIDGLDVSVLNQPIAKVAFNPATGYMDYDPAYTKSIKKELERLKEELAARLKELEAEKKAKQKGYDAAIAAGNKAFNADKWAEAKPHYEKAASIFPKEAYPPEQLAEIDAQLNANAASEKAYTDAIAKADAAFTSKEWVKSTEAYQSALTIKENEEYPEQRIKEIESILANQEKLDEDYSSAIAAADQSFGEQDYEKAKENYVKASGLKTEEVYPKTKIKEIDDLVAALAEKEKGYTDAIAAADGQFEGKEYQKAIESYNKALTFKSEEEYPKEKITEATTLLAGLKQLQEDYDKLIADADAAFDGKEYDAAKTNYEEASELFSNEQHPKDRLLEIESILNAAAKLDEDYAAAVAQGDNAFGKENYEAAQIAFEKALTLKSEEEYPKEKIEEIKTLLAELAAKKAEDEAAALAQKEIDDKYNGFIIAADNALGTKEYDNAIKNYESAIGVKEEEQYPKDKIEEINELLAELERKKEEDDANTLAQKELDEQYNAFITAADAALAGKDYDGAVENYTEASGVKSEEQYPKDKLKEIEDLLAPLEKKNEEDELAAESERKKREYFDALVAEADGELSGENYTEAESKYTQALGVIPGEQYPQDKLLEIKDILAKIKAEADNANLAQKELDDKYLGFVAAGDASFGTEDYATATTNYKSALNVKSEEEYPQEQLDKIEELLEELARKEAEITLTNNALKQKQEQYNAFVKLADEDLSNKRYEKAISNYEQALGIMPDKTYPRAKIEEINQLLAANAEKNQLDKAAALAEKEKRDAYFKLVYDGNKMMTSKDYIKAQGKYNAALGLYPDEEYPSEKLAEILELLKEKPKEEEVEVAVAPTGSRAKINDNKEREIEARMAKLLGKRNVEKAKALQKDRDIYNKDEEIRVSGGIERTSEADERLGDYTDDIIAQAERGNKYHIENNKSLLVTTSLLEKAEKDRIRDADKKRVKADEALEEFVENEIAFVKEQQELSKDKTESHNVYVDDVNETSLIMVERADKIRVQNKKDVDRVVQETEKNDARAKQRSLDMEMDVHKYRSDLAKEEEIKVSAAIKRTDNNQKDLDKLAEEMASQKVEKSKHYKLNVEELIKFKARIDKLETQRIERADKARAANQKLKDKMEADMVKNVAKKDKRYYKDIKHVDKLKKSVAKQELAFQKKAEKKRGKSSKELVKAKEQLGKVDKSQEKRYKDFKKQLDQERRDNTDFMSELQANEQEKTLLANAELSNFYMGEKQPRQDDELSKKYAQGITEETTEAGNSITITRIKVTGTQADVYERIFYTWGGTFFYKNGINITQSLWDKESIE